MLPIADSTILLVQYTSVYRSNSTHSHALFCLIVDCLWFALFYWSSLLLVWQWGALTECVFVAVSSASTSLYIAIGDLYEDDWRRSSDIKSRTEVLALLCDLWTCVIFNHSRLVRCNKADRCMLCCCRQCHFHGKLMSVTCRRMLFSLWMIIVSSSLTWRLVICLFCWLAAELFC